LSNRQVRLIADCHGSFDTMLLSLLWYLCWYNCTELLQCWREIPWRLRQKMTVMISLAASQVPVCLAFLILVYLHC